MKASVAPSGDHLGHSSVRGPKVSRAESPPMVGTDHTADFAEIVSILYGLPTTKATIPPSGEILASATLLKLNVSSRVRVLLVGITTSFRVF